jgi:hypothetical protein
MGPLGGRLVFFRGPRARASHWDWEAGARIVASTSAAQQGFQNFFKKSRAAPTPMGARAPVRGACVSTIGIAID